MGERRTHEAATLTWLALFCTIEIKFHTKLMKTIFLGWSNSATKLVGVSNILVGEIYFLRMVQFRQKTDFQKIGLWGPKFGRGGVNWAQTFSAQSISRTAIAPT